MRLMRGVPYRQAPPSLPYQMLALAAAGLSLRLPRQRVLITVIIIVAGERLRFWMRRNEEEGMEGWETREKERETEAPISD